MKRNICYGLTALFAFFAGAVYSSLLWYEFESNLLGPDPGWYVTLMAVLPVAFAAVLAVYYIKAAGRFADVSAAPIVLPFVCAFIGVLSAYLNLRFPLLLTFFPIKADIAFYTALSLLCCAAAFVLTMTEKSGKK
ncbi:MAG: hypothetical protein IJ806_09180 [Ruminococcus sp.]|nr:hypothetical protein [Ruminococcus sp.]